MAANIQDVIMLFGDSITQGAWEENMNGFGQRLSHVYARKLDVLNRGLSGYNTEWAIPIFEKCLAKRDQVNVPKVQLLVVWFGANDACIEPSPQHVPLAKFIINIRRIVNIVRSPESEWYSPLTRIILITPPPVNTYQRQADLASRDPPLALDRYFEVTKAYADAVRDVATEEKVPLVDVWTDMWVAAGEREEALSKYLIDGLHPNENGYKIMYDSLIKIIWEKYPEVHYDNLQPVFPPWLSQSFP